MSWYSNASLLTTYTVQKKDKRKSKWHKADALLYEDLAIPTINKKNLKIQIFWTWILKIFFKSTVNLTCFNTFWSVCAITQKTRPVTSSITFNSREEIFRKGIFCRVYFRNLLRISSWKFMWIRVKIPNIASLKLLITNSNNFFFFIEVISKYSFLFCRFLFGNL